MPAVSGGGWPCRFWYLDQCHFVIAIWLTDYYADCSTVDASLNVTRSTGTANRSLEVGIKFEWIDHVTSLCEILASIPNVRWREACGSTMHWQVSTSNLRPLLHQCISFFLS
jgi:hypothetical protein